MVSLLFLVARVTVPDAASNEPFDLIARYQRDRRKIMTLFTLFALSGLVVNLTLPGFATSELLAIGVAMIALFAIAWRWDSPKVQIAVIVANTVLMTYYAVRYEPLLT
jgi:hypothetical protein